MRLLLLLFLLTILSCSGKNQYIESFYYKEDIQQYYVKAIEFKGSDASLLVDFTFKNDTTMAYSTICNFTVESKESHVLPLKGLQFTVDGSTFTVNEPKVLFAEGSNGRYRFTSNLTTEQFKKIVFSQKIGAEVSFTDWKSAFTETKKIREVCTVAQQDILFK